MIERVLERTRLPLYRNAILLLSNSAIVAGLGFLFWNLAARLYTPADTTVVVTVTAACAVAAAVAAAGIGIWAPSLVTLAPWPVLAIALIALAALTGASTALVYVAVSARDTLPALAGGRAGSPTAR
jgi:hypothetical protein